MKSPELHIVKIARALSDVSRVRIVREIAKCRGATCGAAVKIAGLSQPTVSHHVKVLIEFMRLVGGTANDKRNLFVVYIDIFRCLDISNTRTVFLEERKPCETE